MLRLTSFRRLCYGGALFGTFNARTRWQGKEAKYGPEITSVLYGSQKSSGSKAWTNIDNPPILAAKEPFLEIFLNKVLQDIANRYKLMQGQTVKCMYGLNCYGLQVVETVRGKDVLDPLRTRQLCRAYATEALSAYKAAFRKWGILCDTNTSYYATFGIEDSGTE